MVNTKNQKKKKKIEQELFLEYLLDPCMTYDEAKKLSQLETEIIHHFPSHNDQQVNPSTASVPVGI